MSLSLEVGESRRSADRLCSDRPSAREKLIAWVSPRATGNDCVGGCSLTAVKSSRVSSSVAFVACAASLIMTLAACGSDSDTSSSTTTSSASDVFSPPSFTETATEPSPCPPAAPKSGGTPAWTLPGATGSVAVTGPTDTTAPLIKVEAPFSVTETQVHTLVAGDGPVVADTATVFVCYMGVNGRDGTVFYCTYKQGAP